MSFNYGELPEHFAKQQQLQSSKKNNSSLKNHSCWDNCDFKNLKHPENISSRELLKSEEPFTSKGSASTYNNVGLEGKAMKIIHI